VFGSLLPPRDVARSGTNLVFFDFLPDRCHQQMPGT
jgi:hypothetical protein